MSRKQGVVFLVVASVMFFATGLAHFSCVFFGPECYSIQMAPTPIVESAKAGTWLAPLAAVVVAVIFTVLGLYGLSGAGILPKLPLQCFGIYSISVVCVVRGLLPIQLYFRHPEKVSDPILVVGVVWLLVGLLYFFGYKAVNEQRDNRKQ